MKMNEMFKTWTLLSTLMATMTPTSVDAGLKYWTTGRYDADSYVQEGLVLNYDGIRNVGLDQPHSKTTTTWVNLGSEGSKFNLTQTKTADGAWGDDGFDFKGLTTYASKTAFTIGPQYTVQALLDAKTADQGASGNQIGYILFPVGTENNQNRWQQFSFAIRGANMASSSSPNRARLNSSIYFSNRDITGAAFNYLTALSDGTFTSFFTGTTISNKGNLQSGKTLATITPTIWAIGGNPGSSGTSYSQALFGTIKSYRHYSRALDEKELVWNRAVDDYRFFGKLVSTIPLTNAVIASSIATISANEAAGAYAVDSAGYAFTAPASKTVDGRVYTCTGYTLENWDSVAGDWGEAANHAGELSCAATETSRIRITWQWDAGAGIVTRYTTADYVQDGLILHYDGIRNVGVDQPHSYDTTQWKNLAPNGGWDLTFATYNAATKPGEWRKDGYRFEGQSNFKGGAIALPTNQTIQVALYGNGLDQDAYNISGEYSNEAYIYYLTSSAFNKAGSLSVRRDSNNSGNNEWIDWTVHGYGEDNTRPDAMAPRGKPILYFTAVLADTFGAVFFGTSVPTAETSRWAENSSRRNFTKGPPTVQNATSFGIGGLNNAESRLKFTGLLNNFRFYGRVLTDEELAHNRVVDNYRFHGIMPVTNVVVATSHSFLSGNEANGNYEIAGAYTFSASAEMQKDARGFEYALDGYTVEAWDANAMRWGDPTVFTGASYTYTVGTSPAKVRLTWRWKATKALRTAADYGIEDIVPNGLVLHYDGIKNIGAESADVTNPTSSWSRVWVNLADPSQYNLLPNDKATPAGGWADDGYAFTNTSSKVGGWFKYPGEFTFGPSYSIQTLLDAKVADQVDSTCGYIMFNGGTWQKAALGLRTSSDYNYALYWVCDTAFGESTRPKLHHASKEYTYGTVIVEDTKAAFFDGVDVPTSGAGLVTKSTTATAQTVPQLCLGGGQGYTQDFTGTIKSFRYYDRVLTADELVRNRNVDSARHFGALAVTNVFVAAGGGEQAETGAYAVEGAWTFTASTVVGPRGRAEAVVRFFTEELVDGEWKNKVEHSGNSFTYTAGTDAATIRLTWKGLPVGTMMTFR